MSRRLRINTLMGALVSWLAACSSGSGGSDAAARPADGPADRSGGDTSLPIGPVGGKDGAAPDEGAGAGTALAKLCNGLTRNGASITISVDVGVTAPVRLTADSGTCSSTLGQMCQTIPSGMQTLTFFVDDQMSGTAQVAIMDGEEIVLTAGLNAMGQGSLKLTRVSRLGQTCAAFDAFAVPDGGAPGADAGAPADGGASSADAAALDAGHRDASSN